MAVNFCINEGTMPTMTPDALATLLQQACSFATPIIATKTVETLAQPHITAAVKQTGELLQTIKQRAQAIFGLDHPVLTRLDVMIHQPTEPHREQLSQCIAQHATAPQLTALTDVVTPLKTLLPTAVNTARVNHGVQASSINGPVMAGSGRQINQGEGSTYIEHQTIAPKPDH
jgi:hypothetical protein